MYVGATEACVDAVSLAGFARMRALSTSHNPTPSTASRPFDRERDGFVLAEGAGVIHHPPTSSFPAVIHASRYLDEVMLCSPLTSK